MDTEVTRRRFLQSAAAAAAIGPAASAVTQSAPAPRPSADGPIVIASANGVRATAEASRHLTLGGRPVDAAVAGVAILEGDPNDDSVGYGGLPNEQGVVQLDACVMDGPSHDSGSVAALERIKHPAQVALRVMRRTDHAMIVGEGALAFARAHGFPEENLLTERARKAWLRWKETHSDRDDWLPPLDPPDDEKTAPGASLSPDGLPYTHGTVNCLARSPAGDLGGVTTTSGLSYKIPGRIGDSPIIGAGLYVDNEIGAAGSTGRGEAVIKNAGAFAVVELMRTGRSPTDACLEVLRRIVSHVRDPRLLDDDGRPRFDVKMYALAKSGQFGAAAIWSGARFAVFANGRNRLEKAAFLFERPLKHARNVTSD